MITKHKPARSEEYLDYIRRKPCWVCQGNSEPHHTGERGVGQKGSDFSAMPLCTKHHRECHDMGKDTFQERYEVVLAEAVAKWLVRWCDKQEVES